ncbi:MAG: aminomethyl-transferring glycine dehydrogenase [Planctomycetaceae bacterium]|nr:aminomethyl-transferring glycine dehydrogenase [Planctomycetaceae bacterium]
MTPAKPVFPYIPNSVPQVKAQMLEEVGASDIMDLYEEIPAHLRFPGRLDLPEPLLDEYSLKRHLQERLEKNQDCTDNLNFLGAGCAQHFVPAVCDEINGRGEFLTAYVGEAYADHGKWQALFEYCSLMGELLDMDVLSCPLYDGAQAAATSVRMAARITGRHEVLIPATLNPELLLVLQNYCQPDLSLVTVGFDRQSGQLNVEELRDKTSLQTAAILVENPSYLGFLEAGVGEFGRIAQQQGAELIVYTDPICLGVIAPPSHYGARITCGDFQPLGMHMQAGGGQGGFIATVDDMKYVSEFKDLMFGITDTVCEGEYGFGEVLFDRTSYGSREKGKEYTGTTTGLWAITAAVYLSLMGPRGMEETGRTIMQMSQYAAGQLARIGGIQLGFQSPFFKEFVLDFNQTGKSVAQINESLREHHIFGGKDLSSEFPELGQSALYCVTETKTKADIDTLVNAVQEVIDHG